MNSRDFTRLAIETVAGYHNEHADGSDQGEKITEDDVRVVWPCKTLQNNKAILSIDAPGGMLYEFTWNGNREQGYLDVYKKQENIVVHPDWMAD